MRTFALLFSVGLLMVPFTQAKPDVPAQKVTPAPTPVAEPLPELLATKITLLQTQFQNLQLTLQATPAYKEFAAGSEALGKQMDALLAPYQLEHKCTVDQIAKTCLHKAEK
jgi:hypothetical protein